MKHQREDAVSTMIGKQLGTIRRLFDRDRSIEAAKIRPVKRGGRKEEGLKRCGGRSTEKGSYFRRTAWCRLDFRGFIGEMNVIRVNAAQGVKKLFNLSATL